MRAAAVVVDHALHPVASDEPRGATTDRLGAVPVALVTVVGVAGLAGLVLLLVRRVAPGLVHGLAGAPSLTWQTAAAMVLLGVAGASHLVRSVPRRVPIIAGLALAAMAAPALYRDLAALTRSAAGVVAHPPSGMDVLTAASCVATGLTLAAVALHPRLVAAFGVAHALGLSFGLTTLLAHALAVQLPLQRLGAPMPLLAACGLTLYGAAMLADAWRSDRAADGGPPSWSPAVAAIAAGVLFIGFMLAVQGNAGLLQAALVLGSAGKLGTTVHRQLRERRASHERLSEEQAARHRAEVVSESAREQQRWLERVLDLMPVPLLLIDPQGAAVTFANAAADALAGGAFPRGARGGPPLGFVDARGRPLPPDRTPIARVAAGERLEALQVDCLTAEGRRTLLVHGALLPASDGHPPIAVMPLQDISSLRRAEETSTRLARIVDRTSNEILTFDAVTLALREASASALRDLGYSLDELRAMTMPELCPELGADGLTAVLEPLRTGERDEVVCETVHRRRDGTSYPVETRLQISRADTPPVFVAVAQNITARRRAERERATALERDLAARDEFFGVVTHDLQMPLSVLELHLQSLTRLARRGALATVPADRATKMLESATRHGRHLRKLIDDLLDASRITSGRLDLELEQVDLVSIVYNVVARLGEELARAGCAVTVQANAAAVGLWDNVRLEQLVAGLVSRAMKSGAGRPIELSVQADGALARLSVRDHGAGVTPERLAGLFALSEQGAAAARQYGGLGLGLHLVRRIVDALGGTIEVASHGDDGATIMVALPRERAEHPGATAARGAAV